MVVAIGLGIAAVVAGFAYLNKKAELAIAKRDIQYAHEKLAALESAVKQEEAKVVGAAKAEVVAVIAKVRGVLAKYL